MKRFCITIIQTFPSKRFIHFISFHSRFLKRISFLHFLILVPTLLYPQTPKQESFFPHHVGDIWRFAFYEPSSGLRDTLQTRIVNDSLLSNGTYYVKFEGGFGGRFIIDSSNQIFSIGSSDTNKIYDLTAPIGSSWSSSQWFKIEVDTIFESNILGIQTTIKVFNFYRGKKNDNFLFKTDFLARGLGLVQVNGYEAYFHTTYLIGAIINNVHYGTINALEDVLVSIPEISSLSQNYPNPFNSGTTIRFSIKQTSEVALNVYNVLGSKVRTVTNEEFSVGEHWIFWDGKDDKGVQLQTGLYIYELVGKDIGLSRKAMLNK